MHRFVLVYLLKHIRVSLICSFNLGWPRPLRRGTQAEKSREPNLPGLDGAQVQTAGAAVGHPHPKRPTRVLFPYPFCQ